jgi:hypothetical protein
MLNRHSPTVEVEMELPTMSRVPAVVFHYQRAIADDAADSTLDSVMGKLLQRLTMPLDPFLELRRCQRR